MFCDIFKGQIIGSSDFFRHPISKASAQLCPRFRKQLTCGFTIGTEIGTSQLFQMRGSLLGEFRSDIFRRVLQGMRQAMRGDEVTRLERGLEVCEPAEFVVQQDLENFKHQLTISAGARQSDLGIEQSGC